MHIPKTGGTSIESVDVSAPIMRFKSLRAIRHPERSNYMHPNGTCHRSVASRSLWHFTASQLSSCGLYDRYNPYLDPHQDRYCVVRDPLDRFFSNFMWMRQDHIWPHLWPHKHCDHPNASRVAEQLVCFAVQTQQWLRRVRRPSDFVRLGDFTAHMQPQSNFMSGPAGCNVVFAFEVLQHANLSPEPLRKGWRRQLHAAHEARCVFDDMPELKAKVRDMYPEDDLLHRAAALRTQSPPLLNAMRRWPRAVASEPVCAPRTGVQCSCSACCRTVAVRNTTTMVATSADERRACLMCVLNHTACGGPGPRRERRFQ